VHDLSSFFILAYHGCDRSVAEHLLNYKKPFRPSANEYDWLGSGIYFWESNPARALDWARHLKKAGKGRKNKITSPYAVGAVIDLGYCLDLVSSTGIEFVRAAYADLKDYMEKSGARMPANKGGDDLLQRHLDCAVINHIHSITERAKGRPFETVRGVFLEGNRIYETSGFFEKTHIQICVRNLKNIKAVFRVPPAQADGPPFS
jgi:hypothetical protein